MNIIRLEGCDTKSTLMDELFSIYSTSMPTSEQKPRIVLEKMLTNPDYYFYISSEDNLVIGFIIIYSPSYCDYCLLEYIAVDSKIRNKGYGGEMMKFLTKEFHNKNMLIEVDSPLQLSNDQKIREKRVRFYVGHGSLCIEGLNYILPLNTNETPPNMMLMICSKNYKNYICKEKIISWLTDIYVTVYGCNQHDERIKIMVDPLPEEIKILDYELIKNYHISSTSKKV
ncbi:MAG: hypothetical protein ACJA02_000119 [Myxococcota bacterium]|jgi:hypothetical protein